MTLDLSALLRGEQQSAANAADTDSELIVDPIDGRLINPDDADSLIDAYEQAKEANTILYAWQCRLRELISCQADGPEKTQRVRGQRRVAKVEKPSNGWDQSILKEAYNSYPKLRDELLGIATLNVKKREFAKAIKTNGPDDYNMFVGIVASAEKPATGLPTITIET